MEKIAIIFLLVFILAWNSYMEKISWIPFNWFNIPVTEELYLIEYPKEISSNAMQFKVYSSKNYTCLLNFCNKTLQKSLTSGFNEIEQSIDDCGQKLSTILSCGESYVRFYSERTNLSSEEQRIEAKIDTKVEKRTLELGINFNTKLNGAAYKNFEILVDGNIALNPTYLFQGGMYASYKNEKISLEPGRHIIELRYGNKTLDKESVSINGQPYPLQTLIDIILSLALAFLINKKYTLDWLTSSLMFFGLSCSAIALQFQLQKNLEFNEWLVPIFLVCMLVLLWKSKKKR